MHQNRPFYLVSLLLLSGYTIYLLARIISIPITHDEAGTILNFSTQSVWDIVTYKDPIPNNHILHTLLVKAFTGIFGYSELACRLPNFIGGILYWIFGFLIVRRLSERNAILTITGILLLTANPYVIEFFGLARGYGLSIAWMIVSLYLLIRNEAKYWIGSLLFAGMAVYTNLTLLNYFIPLTGLVTFLIILRSGHQRNLCLTLVTLLFVLVVLSISLPVYKMVRTEQFQYWGTTGFYSDTFLPLLQASLMNKRYLGVNTVEIVSGVILLFAFLSALRAIQILGRMKKGAFFRPDIQLGYMFFATIAYNIFQNIGFNLPNLNARTALLFYPLFILSTYGMLLGLPWTPLKKMILILPFVVLALWHIKTSFNLHSAYEWWYDGDNKKVMKLLVEDHSSSGERDIVVFKCNWLFQPSLTYYSTIYYQGKVAPPPYSKTMDTTEKVDYYYILAEDKNSWFDRNYTVLQSFAWDSRYLMKRIRRND